MAFDAHKNFAYSTIATAPSPAASGTSLVVASGDGANFPAVSFNAVIWPAGTNPTKANAEIVRVTNISTDTFTITRAQESSTARTVVVGDQIAAAVTAKTFTDIETATLDLFGAPAANVPFNAKKITGLGLATAGTDAASLANTLDQFGAPAADVPMNSHKLTGLAAGAAAGDSVRYEQVPGVVTAAGDLIYASASGVFARRAIGSGGQVLGVNGNTGLPVWAPGGVDPLAVAMGLINWNFPLFFAGGSNSLTSQRIDAVPLWIPNGTTITNIILNTVTAGTSTAPTGFFVGLATATSSTAGTIRAQSNDLHASANLTTTGLNAYALNATYLTNTTDSPNGLYYVLILQNGAFAGTNVAFARSNSSFAGKGLSTNPIGFGNVGTSQTSLPSNGSALTYSSTAGIEWLVGVS